MVSLGDNGHLYTVQEVGCCAIIVLILVRLTVLTGLHLISLTFLVKFGLTNMGPTQVLKIFSSKHNLIYNFITENLCFIDNLYQKFNCYQNVGVKKIFISEQCPISHLFIVQSGTFFHNNMFTYLTPFSWNPLPKLTKLTTFKQSSLTVSENCYNRIVN